VCCVLAVYKGQLLTRAMVCKLVVCKGAGVWMGVGGYLNIQVCGHAGIMLVCGRAHAVLGVHCSRFVPDKLN
jgi:uncharacterized membrane protein YcfT